MPGRPDPTAPRATRPDAGPARPDEAAGLVHDDRRARHGRQDPVHVRGCRQGAAGRHGAAAHQPPARLPGVRQGRRVPPAEPGDEQRPLDLPLRGRQAHLPQADQHLLAGAARPRALRALRPLHPLLRADRRRPVHRARRARCAAAGRHLRGPAVRELLLGQHRADLPGGRPHRRGLPLPVPPVRPRVDAERVRALRERLRAAHRPPPRQRAAPDGAERPGGQRGVELRQGPLGLRLHHARRPPRAAAGARRRRRAARRVVARGPRGRRRRAARRLLRRRARRRPGQRRGRLRLRQVRAHRARHQRRRLPRPPALRRGGRLPRLHRRRHRPRRRRGHLRRPRVGRHRAARRAWSPRTRARSSSCACARRSASTAPPCMPWPRSRPVASPRWAARSSRPPRHRARGAGRPRRRAPAPTSSPPRAEGLRDNAVVLVGERLATVPGALSAAAALAEATGARLAWVPRRAGERGALEAGALPTLLPGGRPLADAAARAEVAAAWGVESLARHRGP